MKMNIIIDTREQKPLKFEGINTMVDTLECGDYSLVGHDMANDDYSIRIERKETCREFARNLGANWKTFEKELKLLQNYKNRMILVCEPECWYKLYNSGQTKLHPNFVKSRITEIQCKYQIPVFYFRNRDEVKQYIYYCFDKILKITNEEN